MKNLVLFPLLLVLVSCSDNSEKKDQQQDTAAAAGLQSIQTDSGRLVLDAAGKAVLYDAGGKIRGRGEIRDNQAFGAWIRYDENGNILSAVQLLEGKPLMQLDKNDFNFRHWQNKEFGAAFLVPKDWKELPSPNPALLASFEKEVKDTSVHVRPNFNVARAQLQPNDSLHGLAKLQLQMQHGNFERVDVVDEGDFTVDGCSAFRRYGMYTTAGRTVGFYNVIIVSGRTAWFFSCEAQNNDRGEFLLYQGVFQQVVESFRRVQ